MGRLFLFSTVSDQEQPKLFNKLCKTYSRHGVSTKSMHTPAVRKTKWKPDARFANTSHGIIRRR